MRGVRVALSVAATAVGAYAGASLLVALRMRRPLRLPVAHPEGGERLRFRSLDGTDIAATLFPGGASAVVLVHGKDRNRCPEPGGQEARHIEMLRGAGYTVLALDLGGHGESADALFTFGIREALDVAAAVDVLLSRGYAPRSIALFGESLGAAAALLALGPRPGVGAVVADSAYADAAGELFYGAPALAGIPRLLVPGLIAAAFVLGADLRRARPESIVRARPRVPMLFIHTRGDPFVPARDALRLRRASAHPVSAIWLASGDEHTSASRLHPEEYARRVLGFLERALAQGNAAPRP